MWPFKKKDESPRLSCGRNSELWGYQLSLSLQRHPGSLLWQAERRNFDSSHATVKIHMVIVVRNYRGFPREPPERPERSQKNAPLTSKVSLGCLSVNLTQVWDNFSVSVQSGVWTSECGCVACAAFRLWSSCWPIESNHPLNRELTCWLTPTAWAGATGQLCLYWRGTFYQSE